MKVLILGGTGAMGVHLVDILAARGVDVYVTSRQAHEDRANVHYLVGDGHDLDFLRRITAGADFDALVDFMIYSTADFSARVAELLTMAHQYVFLSSSRVYSDGAPITEATPRLLDTTTDSEYLATDEYALAKAREENILRAAGTNYTIVRPYITYSNERLQLGTLEKEQWLYRALHGRTIVFTADQAASVTSLTYGYDVADGIAGLLGREAALGEAFHIVTPDHLTWQEVVDLYRDTIERVTGTRPRLRLLPSSEEFQQVFRNKYQVTCDRLYTRIFDSGKVARVGGKQDYTAMRAGLERALTEFIEERHAFRYISYLHEAWLDRQTGEHTPLAEIPTLKEKIKYLLGRYTPFLQYRLGLK